MKCEVQIWTVRDLIEEEDELELTPAYQRGVAWQYEKQSLLLDSIIRGYDFPKLYLAKKSSSLSPQYEIVDGQQRIRAIQSFWHNKLGLSSESLGRASLSERVLKSQLTNDELERFLSFPVTVSVLEDASPTEKRTLFARLQLGERLNPAELRNAMPSSVPRELRSMALTHQFFQHAGIPDKRFNRDDYLTHAFALMEYSLDPNWRDIKAISLKKFVMMRHRGIRAQHLRVADDVLNFMDSIASGNQGVFKNKWSFVDAFYFLFQRAAGLESISVEQFSRQVRKIEAFRKEYNSRPHLLLSSNNTVPHKRLLYDYVNAYKIGGALRTSIETRSSYLNAIINLPLHD